MQIEATQKKTLKLKIDGEFTPEQALEILQKIAEQRSQIANDAMTPEGLPVPTAQHAAWHVQLTDHKGPDTMMAFRHPGLGWVGLTIAPLHRMQLAEVLVAQQRAVMTPPVDGVTKH